MGEKLKTAAKAPETKSANAVSRKPETASSPSVNSPIDRILCLQRTIGNQAVQRLFKAAALQAKLKIGQPNDIYEQEADRVEEQVMRMPEPIIQHKPEWPFVRNSSVEEEESVQMKSMAKQTTHLIQRQADEEEEREGKEVFQAKAAPTAFTGEVPVLRTRRLAAIGAARNAIQRLRNALSRGYIWPFETVSAGGITPAHMGVEETITSREARLRQFITDLIQMVSQLEAVPIPSSWLAHEVRDPSGSFQATGPAAWRDTLMFYAHRAVGLGQTTDLAWQNAPYIETDPIPSRAVRRIPMRRAISLGINVIVPDPENEPLVYRRLTPYEGWQGRGVILEVWQDDFGYFYFYRGRKHYLPRRP